MDLSLSESALLLQKTVRDFAEREIAPVARQLDQSETFPRELVKKLAGLGVQGLTISPEHGGAGGGTTETTIVMEELSRVYAGIATIYSVQVGLCGSVIERFASAAQRKRYLPSLVRGDTIAAYALTEPNAGTDAAALETTATRRDGGYVLNGSKTFISCGDVADLFVVFATVDKAKRDKGITAFLVERGKGMTTRKQSGKMGIIASTTAEVLMEDMLVPDSARVGDDGEGFKIAMQILDTSRIGVAAQALGIAQAALDASVAWAQQRRTFGRPIAEHQGVAFMLADMATQVDAARLLTYRAAALRDAGQPFAKESAMAKLFASETASAVAGKAVQVHGGYGYFKDSIVERCYRDAKITEIYEGTSEVQRIVIARNLVGKGR